MIENSKKIFVFDFVAKKSFRTFSFFFNLFFAVQRLFIDIEFVVQTPETHLSLILRDAWTVFSTSHWAFSFCIQFSFLTPFLMFAETKWPSRFSWRDLGKLFLSFCWQWYLRNYWKSPAFMACHEEVMKSFKEVVQYIGSFWTILY